MLAEKAFEGLPKIAIDLPQTDRQYMLVRGPPEETLTTLRGWWPTRKAASARGSGPPSRVCLTNQVRMWAAPKLLLTP